MRIFGDCCCASQGARSGEQRTLIEQASAKSFMVFCKISGYLAIMLSSSSDLETSCCCDHRCEGAWLKQYVYEINLISKISSCIYCEHHVATIQYTTQATCPQNVNLQRPNLT